MLPPPLELVELLQEQEERLLIRPRPEAQTILPSPQFQRGRWSVLSLLLYLVLPLELIERHLVLPRPKVMAVVFYAGFKWGRRAVLLVPLMLVKLPLT